MNKPLALVTGGARGLGAAIVERLLKRGYRVDVGCRHPDAAAARHVGCRDVRYRSLDIASFAHIRTFVEDCRTERLRYDLIINNAGICNQASERSIDGYEATLATNYLGPFLLTRLLLANAAESLSVVNIGSSRMVDKLDLEVLLEPTDDDMAVAYAASKTLLAAFTAELQDKMPSLSRAVCIHPGLLRTNLGGNGTVARIGRLLSLPFAAKPAVGAERVINALSSQSNSVSSGGLFLKGRAAPYPRCIADREARTKIWNWTSDLVDLPH